MLDLVMARVPSGRDRGAASWRGRELLSRLARRRGLDCPVDGWSPRGGGPPGHPALPNGLYAALSHRDERVVAGLASCPVGLDLEHARARHARRLAALVARLPEPEVRRAILGAGDPPAAFYRAWTLHEALFKLASLAGRPPSAVLATRLASLGPGGHLQAWQWQDAAWTLSICAPEARLRIRAAPRLPLVRLASGALP
ncbi:4'-phosphopantetheinyl transferase superfamily protein [Halomonas nitroreducens]|uniref:4'-phosphopantetheinyl transferase superfamily protein n=1 Tax=Halomonas nitroreducens TaxID=447425 RepID=A0A431V8V7_9GAMM|nr:4'-phosphopantetheinyl transferase superfamily protein [Halomonas nitroreducens]RTR07115.1 4'-phosphopantetheinyl transferase superfamily protein [Halomonas nitroreducens]